MIGWATAKKHNQWGNMEQWIIIGWNIFWKALPKIPFATFFRIIISLFKSMDTERIWGRDEEDYGWSCSDEEYFDDNNNEDELLYDEQDDDVKMEDDCQLQNVPDVNMLGQAVPGCVHMNFCCSLSISASLSL